MVRISVFTPTYNRAYSLPRLYESLKAQTFHDFEWVVVDDGSVDDTEALIRRMQKEKPFFEIRYKKTENGGKHRAINRGMELVRGELMFFVDSDDWLGADALEWIDRVERDLPKDDAQKYAGVQGLKCHTDGTLVGTTFQGDWLDCFTHVRGKHGITGDKAEAYYSELIRKYPFPEIDGENFVTERLVWNRIAQAGYQMRYFNQGIYFCEYLEDGLTHGGNRLYANNPKQWGMAIALDYEVGAMNWFNTTTQYYIYYLWEKDRLDKKEIAHNLSVSVAGLNFAITMQRCMDVFRNMLHKGVTVKNNVMREQAETGAR